MEASKGQDMAGSYQMWVSTNSSIPKPSVSPDMSKAALLLGSNLGNRQENLSNALSFIEKNAGIIEKKSSLYQTAPWGMLDQDDFLNQAVLIKTSLPPQQLLKQLLDIEIMLGRERLEKWGPRIIDIDILYYDSEIIDEKDLKVPHPFLQERRFSLVPLNEISPDWVHPALHKSVNQMLADCLDRGEVVKFEEHRQ